MAVIESIHIIGGPLDGTVVSVRPASDECLRVPVIEPAPYTVEGDLVRPSHYVADVPIVRLPGGTFAVWDWKVAV